MNIAEIVGLMNDGWLRTIAETNGLNCEAADDMAACLSNPDRLKRIYAEMSALEREVLRLWAERVGTQPADEAKLQKLRGHALAGAEFRCGVARLCKRGVLFPFKKTWGERLYRMPVDTYPAWARLLAGGDADEGAPERVREANWNGLEPQLFRIAALAKRHPLLLTRAGSIHKKSAHKLEAAVKLRLPAERIALAVQLPDRSGGLGLPVEVALDIACRLGFLVRDEHRLAADERRIRAWWSLEPSARRRRLWELWWTCYRPLDPPLELAAARLHAAPEGIWLRVDSVRADEPDAWLEWLLAFGWIETGEDSAGNRYVSKLAPIPETDSWHVEPDLELYVPPGVPAGSRWELESFAEHDGSDFVDRYKLTAAGVRRGLEAGVTVRAMLDCLEAGAAGAVPEQVRTTVAEWGRSMERVRFGQAWLLQCRDGDTAALLERDEAIVSMRLAKLSEVDWVMEPSAAERVRSRLEQLDLPALECGGRPDARDRSGESAEERIAIPQTWRAGLFALHASAACYQLDAPPAEPAAEAKQIPVMWLNSFRAYHASTGRDMLQTAIDKQTAVRLNQGGRITRFVPLELIEADGGWKVAGSSDRGERIELSPGQWEEMQLILPGINDTY